MTESHLIGSNFLIIIDFLSRILAALLAIGGILGFAFHRWIEAWIDARFKRKLDAELQSTSHQFSLVLEEKKKALEGELTTHTELLRSRLTRELEEYKRNLDESFRRKAGVFDKRLAYYETFSTEYSGILADLYALDGEWVNTLNNTTAGLGTAVRGAFVTKAHRRLMEAQEKLDPLEPFMDTIKVSLRVAKLFAALSSFIGDGANDKKRLGELALEKGLISAELKLELLGPD